MTSGSGPNIAASVRRRLLNRARERGTDYNLVLLRYLNERLLYRLSQSLHRDAFILKGAMAFDLWIGTEYRPTRDIDFLGHGTNEPDAMESTFREILSTRVEPDGVEFDIDSIETQRMAVGEPYPGVRVRVDANLGGARIKLHSTLDSATRFRRHRDVHPFRRYSISRRQRSAPTHQRRSWPRSSRRWWISASPTPG